MWDHFGGTLTLKSDDGMRRELAMVDTVHVRVPLDMVDAATCGQELRVDV